MEMENEARITELIKKYKIELNRVYKGITETFDGNIKISPRPNDTDLADIRLLKPEIIDFLMAQEAEKKWVAEERDQKIANIEGLTELQNAIDRWERYHYEFQRRMQNENLSSSLPKVPTEQISDVAKKFPRAAAYLKAESYYDASHYAKSAAGRKAVERIINGEDYNTVINEMDIEWSNYCDEHKFDN
jgi:hypothetical protein